MSFMRDEVHVPAGQPVTLRIVNRDGYAHALHHENQYENPLRCVII